MPTKVTDNAVSSYLKEIAKVPLLSKEKEYDLASKISYYNSEIKKIKDKLKVNPADKKYQKQYKNLKFNKRRYKTNMIVANSRLVVCIAKRYKNQRTPLSDLIEEGNLGLIKAVDKYDPEKGVRFSTFATWWIRQKILIYINRMDNYIRLPSVLADEIKKIKRISSEYQGKYGIIPSFATLKKLTKFSNRKLKYIQSIPTDFVSLNIKLHDSEQELVDRIVSESNYQDPEDVVIDNSIRDCINEMLSRLNNKEQKVIKMRFGLNGYMPMVLERVGEKLKLTRERVRQIQAKAIKRLRVLSVNSGLGLYFKKN
ncbi:MAG TPA: sigma-70 family RNA polymerase sigma factor [Spirochaetota bacterium]|nr:sigma-70 family RNA polymerase sigma factor [Spirochaetota bacterium]